MVADGVTGPGGTVIIDMIGAVGGVMNTGVVVITGRENITDMVTVGDITTINHDGIGAMRQSIAPVSIPGLQTVNNISQQITIQQDHNKHD